MAMWTRLRIWLRPPVFSGDEEKTRLAGMLDGILKFYIAVCLLALGGSVWTPRPLLSLGVVGGMILVAAAGVFLLHAGYVRLLSRAVTLILWLLTTTLLALSGGVMNPEVAGFLIVVMVAGLLAGRRTMLVYVVLSLVSAVAIYYAQVSGWLPVLLPMNNFVALTVVFANVTLSTALLYLALRSLGQALGRAHQGEQAALQNAQALQDVLASLEQQVAERTRSVEAARQEAEAARQAIEAQARQASALAQLNQAMSGEQNLPELAASVISQLCRHVDAQIGALFLLEDDLLRLVGSYAYTHRKRLSNQFRLGAGLVGQAALEKQMLTLRSLPPDYLAVQSGLLDAPPRQLLAAPFFHDSRLVGVVELATLGEFAPAQLDYLKQALQSVGVVFNTAQGRARINALLAQTQQQARELSLREEELRAANEELQQQTQALRASQQRLQSQQQALEAVNAELEEKAAVLQEQRATLDKQNQELKEAQQALERKADELARASKYKSEFLANMSHELRTPLNSLLILARMLADNEEGNLSGDQIESARIIYNSGSDLLALINEILDLAKVEAGKMQFHFAPMSLAGLAQAIHTQFEHVAEQRGLAFEVVVEDGLPETIESDQQRVQQVLKNLLSNAFKFTSEGGVRLVIGRPGAQVDLASLSLPYSQVVALNVIDSGIGMTPEQQQVVFEAFQQADGSTSRKYGGTGLGLTISRELALNLGGKIGLQSEHGKGSTFTLYLPESRASAPAAAPSSAPAAVESRLPAPEAVPDKAIAPALARQAAFSDDRWQLNKGDRLVLVVEDDPDFVQVLYEYAHKKDFKCLVALDGESGLQLVSAHRPDAVILDLKLPGISGWQVLEAIKQDPDTRHIPVHILSASTETMDAYKRGAVGFLSKPISPEGLENVFQKIEDLLARSIKNLLIVEDDPNLRHSVRQLLGGADVKISEAAQGQAAMELLRAHPFDCMILDLSLPDMSGFELLNRINADESIRRCPVIVYTGKALTEDENAELMKYADSVIIKGVKSPERLLDEAALFLHRVVSEMSEEKQQAIKSLYDRDVVFNGRHVLLVDDDMRNAFAMSRLMSSRGLKVSIASGGQKAIDLLETTPGVDLVLMDVMMPEMDGYETIRRMRAQARFQSLPILALTAKAMKGDKEKCIEAGANDYLSKPIDAERLFSMLRVWLYR